MKRILVLGLAGHVADAMMSQMNNSEVRETAPRFREYDVNPMAREVCSNIAMHPNDDWRGKGNRKRRFK